MWCRCILSRNPCWRCKSNSVNSNQLFQRLYLCSVVALNWVPSALHQTSSLSERCSLCSLISLCRGCRQHHRRTLQSTSSSLIRLNVSFMKISGEDFYRTKKAIERPKSRGETEPQRRAWPLWGRERIQREDLFSSVLICDSWYDLNAVRSYSCYMHQIKTWLCSNNLHPKYFIAIFPKGDNWVACTVCCTM